MSRLEIGLHLKTLILWNMHKNNELNVHNVITALPFRVMAVHEVEKGKLLISRLTTRWVILKPVEAQNRN